jgi:hypothetical protein
MAFPTYLDAIILLRAEYKVWSFDDFFHGYCVTHVSPKSLSKLHELGVLRVHDGRIYGQKVGDPHPWYPMAVHGWLAANHSPEDLQVAHADERTGHALPPYSNQMRWYDSSDSRSSSSPLLFDWRNAAYRAHPRAVTWLWFNVYGSTLSFHECYPPSRLSTAQERSPTHPSQHADNEALVGGVYCGPADAKAHAGTSVAQAADADASH